MHQKKFTFHFCVCVCEPFEIPLLIIHLDTKFLPIGLYGLQIEIKKKVFKPSRDFKYLSKRNPRTYHSENHLFGITDWSNQFCRSRSCPTSLHQRPDQHATAAQLCQTFTGSLITIWQKQQNMGHGCDPCCPRGRPRWSSLLLTSVVTQDAYRRELLYYWWWYKMAITIMEIVRRFLQN